MLTIENIYKLVNKTLDKKNFYVEKITEMPDIYEPITFNLVGRYLIEITNRKYAINIILYRNPTTLKGIDGECYKLSSRGNDLFLKLTEIKNKDIFLDKLRFVALN